MNDKLNEGLSKQLDAVKKGKPIAEPQKETKKPEHKIVNRLPIRKIRYEWQTMSIKMLRKYAKNKRVRGWNIMRRRGLESKLFQMEARKEAQKEKVKKPSAKKQGGRK